MILPAHLKDLEGSTVSVNYIGPKNAPYTLTGEFQRRSFNKIIIEGLYRMNSLLECIGCPFVILEHKYLYFLQCLAGFY